MQVLARVVFVMLLAHPISSQETALPMPAGPATCGALGDLDGDGALDLVIGVEDRALALLVNDGHGEFRVVADAFASAESKVSALALLDADGDNDLDILVGGVEVLTRLWLNEGKLHFVDGSARLPQSKPWASAFGTGDLDGDGDVDVIVGNRAGTSVLFRNERTRFVLVEDALPAKFSGVTSIALADLDGDKDLDVVFGRPPDSSGKGGRNRAVRNEGKCKFSDQTEAWMPTAELYTMGVALADVDGNGSLDLVCANRGAKPREGARNAVHRRGDDGKFLASTTNRYKGEPAVGNTVAVADVDGDRDMDLVFGNDGTDTIFLNDGKGMFTASNVLPRLMDDTRAVLLADVDGDHDIDIVTINFGGVARRFLNSGTGQFGALPVGDAPAPGVGGNGSATAAKITPVAAGKYASRALSHRTVSEPASRKAIDSALRFLVDQQADDGAFRVNHFVGGEFNDPSVPATHDVGVAALALLCLLAEGAPSSDSAYADSVRDAVKWLLAQQQPSGMMGPNDTTHGIYDHAIATLALAEMHALTADNTLRAPVEKALAEIERRRNPDGGFRYEPGVAPSDTSVTVWCALAQIAGNDGGLAPNAGSTARTLAFLRSMNDPVTGRTGYTERGGLSARTKGEQEVKFPAEQSHAMTGAALFVRLAMGDDPSKHDDMRASWKLLASAPPKAEPDAYFDPYAWLHMAHALCQLGDPEWATWRKELHRVVLSKQRAAGALQGSWDPNDPWGATGGRFASTALATLALQAEYRFARMVDPKWRR